MEQTSHEPVDLCLLRLVALCCLLILLFYFFPRNSLQQILLLCTGITVMVLLAHN